MDAEIESEALKSAEAGVRDDLSNPVQANEPLFEDEFQGCF